jgi:hypothetical protein
LKLVADVKRLETIRIISVFTSQQLVASGHSVPDLHQVSTNQHTIIISSTQLQIIRPNHVMIKVRLE